MKKRIISLLLALAMIVGMVPTNTIHVHATEHEGEIVVGKTTTPTTQPEEEAAVEEETPHPTTEAPEEEKTLVKVETVVVQDTTELAATTYDVYVNGVGMANGTYLANNAKATRPDKPSVGHAYYKDGVLTLNYYNCRGTGYKYDSAGFYALIYADQDLQIVLEGENTLNQTMTEGDGIYFRLDGTVSGSGSLVVSGSTYYGIASEVGNLTVNAASVTVSGGEFGLYSDEGNVIVNGGAANVTSNDYAVYARLGSVYVTDGELTAESIDKYAVKGNMGVSFANHLTVLAATYSDDTLVPYDAANHDDYVKIMVKNYPILLGVKTTGGMVGESESGGSIYFDSCDGVFNKTCSEETTWTVSRLRTASGQLNSMPVVGETYYFDITVQGENINFSGVSAMNCDVKLDYYDVAFVESAYTDTSATITFSAVRRQTYDVLFPQYDSGQTVEAGHKAVRPDDPGKDGMHFLGWYTEDGELYDFDTPVTENINLYAKFGHYVMFYLGESPVASQDIEDGKTATKPEDPYQDGKKFLGWYTEDDQPYDFSTPVTGDLNLHAKFVKTHTVTLMFGDSAVGWLTAEDGKPVVKPEDPGQEGKIFAGWYTEDGKPYDFTKPVTQDLRLYATFTQVAVDGVPLVDGWYLPSGSTTPTKTKPSGGYAYYKDGTLTLNSYTNTGAAHSYKVDSYGDTWCSAIYGSADLNIVLTANTTNTITNGVASSSGGYFSMGISVEGKLTITGEGSLSVATESSLGWAMTAKQISVNCESVTANGSIYVPDNGALSMELSGSFLSDRYIQAGTINIKAKGDITLSSAEYSAYVQNYAENGSSSLISETGKVEIVSFAWTLYNFHDLTVSAADTIYLESIGSNALDGNKGNLTLTAPNGITIKTPNYTSYVWDKFTATATNGAITVYGSLYTGEFDIRAKGDVTVNGGYIECSNSDGEGSIVSETGSVKVNGTTYALLVYGTMDIVAADSIELKSTNTSGTTMIAGSGSLNLTAPNGITLDTTSGYGMSLSGDFTATTSKGSFSTKGGNSAGSLNIEAYGDVTVDGPNGYWSTYDSAGSSRIESKTGSVKVNGTTYALLVYGVMDIVAADSIELKSIGSTMITGGGSLNLTAPNGITLDTTSGYAMSLSGDFTATTSKGSFSTKGMNSANTLNIEAYGDVTVGGPNGYWAAYDSAGTSRIESKTGNVKVNGTTYALIVYGVMDIVAADSIELKSTNTSGTTMITGTGSLNLTAPNGITLDTTSGYGMSLSGDFTATTSKGSFSTKGKNSANTLNIEAYGDVTVDGPNGYWANYDPAGTSRIESKTGNVKVNGTTYALIVYGVMDIVAADSIELKSIGSTIITGGGSLNLTAPNGITLDTTSGYAVSLGGDFTAKTTGGAFTAKGYFYCKNIDIDAYGDVTITSYISLESEDDGTGRIVSRNGKIDISIPQNYEAVIYRGNWTFESKNGTTLTANSALNPERGVFYDALTLDVTGPLKLVNIGGGYVVRNDLTIKGEEVTMIGAPAGLSNAVITYENRNGKAYAVYEGASEATLTAADHEAAGEIYSGYLDANVVKFAEAANVSIQAAKKLELELAGFDTDNLANSVTGKVTSTGAALRSGGYERGILVLTDEEGTPAVVLRDDRMSANTAYWVRFQIRAADGYSLKNLTAADVTLKGYTGVTPVLTYNEAMEVLIVDFLMPKLKPVVYVGGVKLHSGEYLDESGNISATAPSDNYACYKDGVLTLHNYDYSGAGYEFVTGYSAAIYSQYDLEIVLDAGTANTLEATGKYGICVNNRVDRTVKTTIRGTGTLEIDAAGDGVYAYGDLTVNNADLTINSGNYALNVSGTADIENSSLTIDADNFGIYAMTSIDISNAASDRVDIISGTYPVYANNYSVTLSGGKYNLKSVDLEEGVLHHSLFAGKDVSISNADVVIEGAVNGIYTYGTVELQNSSVKIDATADGIFGTDAVSVNGGSLDITSDSFGVFSDGDITIQDAELDITADNGAIVSHKNVTIALIDCDATINGNSFALNAYYGKIYMENTDATFNTAYGILANDVELKGTPDTIVKINSTKECGISSETDIVIAGGTWNVSTLGYDAISATDGITISDAVVTAVGAKNGISQYYGDIEIYNSSVTAKSTATSSDSYYSAIKLYNSGKLIIGDGLISKASTEPDGTLGTYDAAKLSDYDYISITPPCIHKWDSGVVTTPANCEDDGVRTYTCTLCSDTYTESVPAFGHKYDDGVITLYPTLTEKGEKLFTCQRDFCGYSYTQEIPSWTQPVFYKISPEVTQQEFDSRSANMGTTKNTYKFEAKYYLYEELVNAGYTARIKTSVYLDGGTTPHATSYDGYTPDQPGVYKIVHELLVTEPGKAEVVTDTFTHYVTIGYAPDFDTMLPKVTQQQLNNGQADLGTLYEAPTFKLTPTVANWMGENFTVDSHMHVERDQGLGWRDVLSSITNFTYTPDVYGDYRITYTQKLMGHGTVWETHTFVYTFTYAREPLTFKDLTPAPTAAELAAGKKDLGVVNDAVTFSYKVPELTQEEVKMGYKIRTSLEVFDEDGNQVSGLAGTVTDGVYTYKHSQMGKHTIKLILSIYHQPEYQGGATTVETIEMEFTVDLQSNYELKFLTQTPAVTAVEAAAGKTDLGTIERGQVFTCTYTPLPQWMADAGYKVENFTYDYVDGEQVGFGSNYPCNGGGNHVLKMTLVLKDPLGNELQRVEHTYTCYVEPAPAESLKITNGGTIYMDLGSNSQKLLLAQILPLDAVQIIKWSSSDESIVTVDESGMLQAVNYGRATITATNFDGTVSDTCMVFVQGAPFMVDGVYLQPGQYLAQGSRKPTTAKPADNYVYYGPNADGDPQLTLHNYTFDSVGYYNGSSRYAVYAEDFLVIKLEGTSNVSLASAYNRNAFYLHGGAEILGDSDAVLNISNVERGFDVVGGISFEGGTIKINSDLIGIYTDGNVTIAGSDLDITAASAISTEHLKTGNLIVNAGSLTAVSTQQRALNLNGTISFFEGAYAIGSTNADGTDFETYNADNLNTYAYVYIGEKNGGVEVGTLGDLNLDGQVNSDDLTLLARHVGGIELVTGQALLNADVNSDGQVNSDDLTKHARYVGGIITSWDQE